MGRFGNEERKQADGYASKGSSHELSVEQPAINERKLLLKIDLRVLPILCVVYLMAFIERYVPICTELYCPNCTIY
jgi:hypothetical protein